MKLIIGGKYQGKRDYVAGRFGYAEGDVCYCGRGGASPVTDKPVVYGIEMWALAELEAGRDPVAEFGAVLPELRDKIVVCTDMSCGIVPNDPMQRAWREAAGRMASAISSASDEVVRLFCGIPIILKKL
ncbi:MAG: bifunctional adenosylcobinamide kinase/adenosylcobinamide-phosphate guanylyltransferase [Oscillospiraceae bacterium]|nr:bifunctional adenosylcobinamide kinase/adenosylcobinamide-phosphate guanylyltransferase [Oscillospiraceae bacterium]